MASIVSSCERLAAEADGRILLGDRLQWRGGCCRWEEGVGGRSAERALDFFFLLGRDRVRVR